MLTYFNSAIEGGLDRTAAILRTCQVQMRPVMMTCIVACVGLLPAAVSNGIGSQVQKPLALVVVGGILLAPVLILIVLPVLIDVFSKRAAAQGSGGRADGAGRMIFHARTLRALGYVAPLLFSGCAVGPDFQRRPRRRCRAIRRNR